MFVPFVRVSVFASLNILAAAQSTRLVSRTPSGSEGNGDSFAVGVSADGRFSLFLSHAPNMGASVAVAGLFLRDNASGALERIDVTPSGGNPASFAFGPAEVSDDAREVVFSSLAGNLVANDANADLDVFVRDRVAGTTELVSVSLGGTSASDESFDPAITPDGRYVVFSSRATDLVAGDTNQTEDVFVRDRLLGQTWRASVTSSGAQANGQSEWPSISADGRYIAFASLATNLEPGSANGVADVFVRDTVQSTTTRISNTFNGAPSNGHCRATDISSDGRTVVFATDATNLLPQTFHAFAWDASTAQLSALDVGPNGASLGASSWFVSLSADGSLAGFNGVGAGLHVDPFVRDLVAGTTQFVDVTPSGTAAVLGGAQPYLSGDGRYVIFQTSSSDVVPGDTNGRSDAFLRDLLVAAPPTTYCTTATTGQGCTPSISALGTATVGASWGLELRVDGLEPERFGAFCYGISGRTALPFGGTSFRCAVGPLQRLELQFTPPGAPCSGVLQRDWSDFVATHLGALGTPLSAGLVVDAQAWFRDPPAPKKTNFTDAVEFTVVP